MSSQPQIIERPGPVAIPWTYQLGTTEVLRPVTAFAHWDGSGASGAFLPCLTFYSQDGKVFMRVFPSSSVAQGGTADVTYAPFPGGIGAAASTPSTAGALFLTAAGMWPSVTAGAGFPTRVESATNQQNVYVADFVDGSQTFAQASYVMPPSWNAGTVTASIYWMVNGATAGNVVWGVQGRAYGSGATLDAAWGTPQTVTSAATGIANQVIVSASTPAVTIAGTPAGSQLVQFRVYRDGGAVADTLAATARLLGAEIAYTTT